jgi:hypothetical protein
MRRKPVQYSHSSYGYPANTKEAAQRYARKMRRHGCSAHIKEKIATVGRDAGKPFWHVTGTCGSQ